jgi:ATP-dependent DNA ligase
MYVHGVEPMVAKPTDQLPRGANLRYEVKLDGCRCLARIDDRVTFS